MVNLRFHIASLVAVFFALAIGIGVGSSVVRSGVLERTESQLSSLDAKLTERNRSLDAIRAERAMASKVDSELDHRVLDGALDGVSVVVVAAPGTSTKDARRVVDALERSKATVAGVVKVQRSVRLGPEVDARLAAIAVASYSTEPKKVAEVVRSTFVDALTSSTAGVAAAQALVTAKLVELTDHDGKSAAVLSVTESTRVVVVGLADEDQKQSQAFLLPFLRAVGRARPGGVVVVDPPSFAERAAAAEADEDKTPPAGASSVSAIRSDASTASRVSTIDGVLDGDGTTGRVRRVALVLSLLDMARKKVGHFGTASGATSLVPSA